MKNILDFKKGNGLVPAIIQNDETKNWKAQSVTA